MKPYKIDLIGKIAKNLLLLKNNHPSDLAKIMGKKKTIIYI